MSFKAQKKRNINNYTILNGDHYIIFIRNNCN